MSTPFTDAVDPLRALSRSIAHHVALDHRRTWDDRALGLTLGSSSHVQQMRRDVYEPVFALVVQGEKQIVLGDQEFTCRAGTFMIVSVDLPIAFRVSRATAEQPYMALAMTLEPAAIATLLLESGSGDDRAVPAGSVGMGMSDAPAELLDAVVRLIRLLDRPQDVAVLGPLIKKEILWRLLCGEQGGQLRQIGVASSRLARIGRTMRWMREHYREAVAIDDLAHRSAMSVTSFHRNFREVARMTPLQYLKQIRLQEARTRLLASADDVAAVGYAVGYESPSQFSREYKRVYGAPPGRDARLLRAAHVSK